ncbi:MAG: hypothetical protein LBT77_00040 [Mycoplasmataceae bacterium]|jgi:RNA polymerase sigma factor (sigma-70 family)|nr:hypothetical protein [Mycoplasmataceae bacterium]
MTDNELIDLYRNEKSISARDIILARYLKRISNFTIHIKNQHYDYLQLTRDDMTTLAYLAIEKAINKFDTQQNKYQFVQALHVICRAMIVGYIKRFNTKSHFFLNCGVDIDADLVDKFAKCDDEGTSYQEHLENEQNVRALYRFLSTQSALTKRIINLKLSGLDNKMIAQKIHANPRTVYNALYFFIKNAKLQMTLTNFY